MPVKCAPIEVIGLYKLTPFYPALQKIYVYITGQGDKLSAPEVLGQAVAHTLTTPNLKVGYSVAPDTQQTFLMATLPRRMVDRIMGGQLGLLPK